MRIGLKEYSKGEKTGIYKSLFVRPKTQKNPD